MPAAFALEQNYPNPFNPQTTIGFTVAQAGPVRLQVFDVLGRLVETLVDRELAPGRHTAVWEAANRPSGVYFYRLQASGGVEVRQMILLR